MSESSSSSKFQTTVGYALLAIGVAVFVVRLLHAGAYAIPTGGNLLGGLGGLFLGALLVWPAAPRLVRWLALAGSPVVFFLAMYGAMAELEEVISIYATDSNGQPAELRLWIVDREDGMWVGMPRAKAIEHSLHGARIDMLRGGETQCIIPVLYEDRPTVRTIHALKVEKYAVARASAAIGLYPSEARDSSVSLRFDPCPE